MRNKIIVFTLLDFLMILSSLALLIAGYYRIHTVLSTINDYYIAHFGNVGLLYFVLGILLLTLFFILIVIKISKKVMNLKEK